MNEDAKAIARDINAGRWRDALLKVDEFIDAWDNRDAEITDTKTMDMYEVVRIIDPEVRALAPAFEAAPSEDARYANDDEKYEKAWEYIYHVKDLIRRGFVMGGGRRKRSKRSKRGKTARQRRRRHSTLTRRTRK